MTWIEALETVTREIAPHRAVLARLGCMCPRSAAGEICRYVNARTGSSSSDIAADPWGAVAFILAEISREFGPRSVE